MPWRKMKARSPAGTILKNSALKKKPKNSYTIIGIDPGLMNLGVGIIQISTAKKVKTLEVPITKKRSKTVYPASEIAKCVLGYACITFKLKQTRPIEERLYYIYDQLCEIMAEHQPSFVVVEDAFVGLNKNSGLKLGIVRGAILTTLGKSSIPYEAIAPKQIKSEVAERGDAQKEDIYDLFAKLLPKWTKTSLDSSDALAAAFCGIKALINQNSESKTKKS